MKRINRRHAEKVGERNSRSEEISNQGMGKVRGSGSWIARGSGRAIRQIYSNTDEESNAISTWGAAHLACVSECK